MERVHSGTSGHLVPKGGGRHRLAAGGSEIGGAESSVQGRVDPMSDCVGGLGFAQLVEKQGGAEDRADRIGDVLLLDELGEPEAADAVRHGVNATLEAEFRTADLASSEEEAVSTPAFGREVANRAAKRAPQNMSLSSEKA